MLIAVEELPDGTRVRLPAYDPQTAAADRHRAWRAAHPPGPAEKAREATRTRPRARARARALERLARENRARFFALFEEELTRAREEEKTACAG